MQKSLQKKLYAMRDSGAIVSEALELCRRLALPGVTTASIDAKVEDLIRSYGAKPSFKGYGGFPASTCISVNEVIVHGIPGKRKLLEGDIVGFDVGAFLGGYHGDAALTIPIGEVDEESRQLMLVTWKSLKAGVAKAQPGNKIGDIGSAVQKVAEKAGFHVVRDFTGHGVGKKLHERPQIPNYGRAGSGATIKVGDALAIEPMVNVGTVAMKILPDNWTAVVYDGSRSAHYEFTIFITEDGPEILTPHNGPGFD
ncbi:type I methionyl aminopeptidase [bacterium]|nr:type I methionyl aminopeptidase [bacterium]